MKETVKVKRLLLKRNFQSQSKFQQHQISSNFYKFAKGTFMCNSTLTEPSFHFELAYHHFLALFQPKDQRNFIDLRFWNRHLYLLPQCLTLLLHLLILRKHET
jgi:hypothetical protein